MLLSDSGVFVTDVIFLIASQANRCLLCCFCIVIFVNC